MGIRSVVRRTEREHREEEGCQVSEGLGKVGRLASAQASSPGNQAGAGQFDEADGTRWEVTTRNQILSGTCWQSNHKKPYAVCVGRFFSGTSSCCCSI